MAGPVVNHGESRGPLLKSIKHPLRNHGLVGNFHIIGYNHGVFNVRVMGSIMIINDYYY